MVDPKAVADRIASIRDEVIRAGGQGVQLVAVTKSFPVSALHAAVEGGCDAVGENYAQELLQKVSEGIPAVDVHFIGGLQSNKVKSLAPHVSLWQSVESISVIHELAKRAPGARILLQVDTTGEASKGGIAPAEIEDFYGVAQSVGLSVAGLMTIGPTDPSLALRQKAFKTLRHMVDQLDLAVCSMGMSDDFVEAVECGSTLVRVGSRIFGARVPR